jgi:hypothetical protein
MDHIARVQSNDYPFSGVDVTSHSTIHLLQRHQFDLERANRHLPLKAVRVHQQENQYSSNRNHNDRPFRIGFPIAICRCAELCIIRDSRGRHMFSAWWACRGLVVGNRELSFCTALSIIAMIQRQHISAVTDSRRLVLLRLAIVRGYKYKMIQR